MNDLLKTIKNAKKDGWMKADAIEVQVNEYKDFKATENADEVMHTTNIWFGKELIPVDVLTNEIIDIMPNHVRFLNGLTWFHGNNLGKSIELPIIWELARPIRATERTSAALAFQNATDRMPTDKVTIVQKGAYAQVSLSEEELLYSIAKLEPIIKAKLARSFAKEIENIILNWDTNVLAGNINSIETPLPNTDLLLDYDGIRKEISVGTLGTDFVNIGVLSRQNLIETRALLWDWSYDFEDIMCLMDWKTYTKTILLPEYSDKSKNGKESTITKGAKDVISGVELFIPSVMKTTTDDGRISNDPALNVKWNLIYMKRNAVQRGFGQPMKLEQVSMLWQGADIYAWMQFGYTIINKRAWTIDPRLVQGRNITL